MLGVVFLAAKSCDKSHFHFLVVRGLLLLLMSRVFWFNSGTHRLMAQAIQPLDKEISFEFVQVEFVLQSKDRVP